LLPHKKFNGLIFGGYAPVSDRLRLDSDFAIGIAHLGILNRNQGVRFHMHRCPVQYNIVTDFTVDSDLSASFRLSWLASAVWPVLLAEQLV